LGRLSWQATPGLVRYCLQENHIVSYISYTHLMFETAHPDTVSGEFTHTSWWQFPDLSCNTVLFHQRFLKS